MGRINKVEIITENAPKILELCNESHTVSDATKKIQQFLGFDQLTTETVRKAVIEMGYTNTRSIIGGQLKLTAVDKKIPIEDPEEILKDYKLQQKVAHQMKADQADFTMTVNLPISMLVVEFNDMHMGHPDCAIDELERQMDIVKATPGVYCVGGGDYIDNLRSTKKYATHAPHESLSPEKQRALARWFFKEMGPYMIGFVLGNHDRYDYTFNARDLGKEWSPSVWGAYLGLEGTIYLEYPDWEYKIWLAHKTRYVSHMNPSHGSGKVIQLRDASVDAVITGHWHEAFSWKGYVQDKTKHSSGLKAFIRGSGYQKDDDFARWINARRADIHTPSILLEGKENYITPCMDFEKQLDLLDLQNSIFSKKELKQAVEIKESESNKQ